MHPGVPAQVPFFLRTLLRADSCVRHFYIYWRRWGRLGSSASASCALPSAVPATACCTATAGVPHQRRAQAVVAARCRAGSVDGADAHEVAQQALDSIVPSFLTSMLGNQNLCKSQISIHPNVGQKEGAQDSETVHSKILAIQHVKAIGW